MNFCSAVINTKPVMPPTRKCMICDRLENPNADVINEVGWLCDDCKRKLRALIEAVDKDMGG